jgi:hypothetical protein
MILLVKHNTDDGTPVHFLPSHEAAVTILRAFGGDSSLLEIVPDSEPQPDTT